MLVCTLNLKLEAGQRYKEMWLKHPLPSKWYPACSNSHLQWNTCLSLLELKYKNQHDLSMHFHILTQLKQ